MKRKAIVLTSLLLLAACQQTPFPMEPLQTGPVNFPQAAPPLLRQAQGYGFATTKTPLPITDSTLSAPDVVGELQIGAVSDAMLAGEESGWEETDTGMAVPERKLGPGELRIVYNTGPISYTALEDLQANMPDYVPYPVYVPQYIYSPTIVVQPSYGPYLGTPYYGGSYGGWNPRPRGGRPYGRGAFNGSRFQGSQMPGPVYPLPSSQATPVTPPLIMPPGTVAPMVGGVKPFVGGVAPFVPGTPGTDSAAAVNATTNLPDGPPAWTSSGGVYRSSSVPFGSSMLMGGVYPGASRPTPMLVPMAPQGGLYRSEPRLGPPRYGPSASPRMPGVAPFMPPGSFALPMSPPGLITPLAQ